MDAFWQHGYEGVAIADLCKATRLNPGSLYGAFGDKRALFLAVLDRYIDTVSIQAVARITAAPSGLEGVREFFEFLLEAIASGRRRFGCLVTNALAERTLGDRETEAKAQRQLVRLTRAFTGALNRAERAGEIAEGDNRARAAMLVCLVQGMNILAKSNPSRRVLRGIVGSALDGLTTSVVPEARVAKPRRSAPSRRK